MEENNYQTGNDTNAQDGMQSGAENVGTDAVNNSTQQTNTTQQNNEPYEQRPSQLYGRTAYQQQNQANAQNNNPYGNQNGYNNQYNNPYGNQNGYNNQNNNPYGNQNGYNNQYNNPYGNQNGYNNQNNNPYGNQNGYNNQYNNPYGNQNGYNNYNNYNNQYNNPNRAMHGNVSDIFCYVLLVLMPLANIISIITYDMTIKVLQGISFTESFYDEYMNGIVELSSQPAYMALAMISNVISIGYIVFVILDIVKIHKENYKITGLILFAIFLKPGYFLWRAHVLGRKKTGPVIYTIAYCVLILGQLIFYFARALSISMPMVESMY